MIYHLLVARRNMFKGPEIPISSILKSQARDTCYESLAVPIESLSVLIPVMGLMAMSRFHNHTCVENDSKCLALG